MERRIVEGPPLTWIDVVQPTLEELQKLAAEHHFPATVVEDCLEPDHLPKYERIGDATFVILRVHDFTANDDASSIQELTRKVAIFFRDDLVLTVHRVELAEVTRVQERFAAHDTPYTEPALLAALTNATLASFEQPLGAAETTLDAFEGALFDETAAAPSLKEAYNLKRRVSLTRRILWQTANVVQKLMPATGPPSALYQDVRESVDAYLFWADQLLEEVNLLLQVHLAVGAHKTNDVMRILTALSAIFLPLTFIVGVYGMNFDFMPELRNPNGYPAVLLLMFIVAGGILAWFRWRGWLGGTTTRPE